MAIAVPLAGDQEIARVLNFLHDTILDAVFWLGGNKIRFKRVKGKRQILSPLQELLLKACLVLTN